MIFKLLPLSRVILVFANLIPLLGVFFLSWEIFPLLYLYWLENAIIGFFTFLKILTARGPRTLIPPEVVAPRPVSLSMLMHIPLALFFVLHYGMFTFVHGIFLRTFFPGPGIPSLEDLWPFAAALFLSHGFSWWSNYLGRHEYLKLSAVQVMRQPYGRIVIMHLTVLLGAVLAEIFQSRFGFLVLLVVLKTTADLGAHIMEHKSLEPAEG